LSDESTRPAIITQISVNDHEPAFSVRFVDGNLPETAEGLTLAQLRVDVEADQAGMVSGSEVRAEGLARRVSDQLAALQAQLHGDPAPARVEQRHNSNFVDWKSFPYFFASAWPTLFMPDALNTSPTQPTQADIPAEFHRVKLPRHKKIDFFQYCRHLMRAADGRYAAHPTLAYALLNIKQRAQVNSFFSAPYPPHPFPTPRAGYKLNLLWGKAAPRRHTA
jgi:hypothetical protein